MKVSPVMVATATTQFPVAAVPDLSWRLVAPEGVQRSPSPQSNRFRSPQRNRSLFVSTLEYAVEAATPAPELAAVEDIGDVSGWETRGSVEFTKWQVMVDKLNDTIIEHNYLRQMRICQSVPVMWCVDNKNVLESFVLSACNPGEK